MESYWELSVNENRLLLRAGYDGDYNLDFFFILCVAGALLGKCTKNPVYRLFLYILTCLSNIKSRPYFLFNW